MLCPRSFGVSVYHQQVDPYDPQGSMVELLKARRTGKMFLLQTKDPVFENGKSILSNTPFLQVAVITAQLKWNFVHFCLVSVIHQYIDNSPVQQSPCAQKQRQLLHLQLMTQSDLTQCVHHHDDADYRRGPRTHTRTRTYFITPLSLVQLTQATSCMQ